MTGTVGITFAFYAEQEGGAALWMETQNVVLESGGKYAVQLGATNANGLPTDLFNSGAARWLGVRVNGGNEQPRILLLSVPYALKAGDAETVGGLPPTAFVLAAPANSGTTVSAINPASPRAAAGAVEPPATGNTPVTTAGGTSGKIPVWDSTSDITNSVMSQSTIGSVPQISVNGTLALPNNGTATTTSGKKSRPLTLTASAFNSTTASAVNQIFQWQSEPAGNNTATSSGTLNLLFGSGSTTPGETGLKISSKGIFTFASGQTFPGTGPGTITGVIAGTDLTGGGTSGNVALKLDTTKVPQLGVANAFTSNNTIGVNTAAEALTVTNGTGDGAKFFGGYDAAEFFGGAGGGIYVDTHQDSDFAAAIYANQFGGESTQTYGVWAYNQSLAGAGVYGVQGFASTLGQGQGRHGAVWGDSGRTEEMSIYGTADDGFAVVGQNDSIHSFTALFQNFNQTANSPALFAGGSHGYCIVDGDGDLSCSGTKSAVVPVDGGARRVALYAIEGPENWFEDLGGATLLGGAALVRIEPAFAQTVNTDAEYRVFLTPNGDCKGLYVTNKTANSFEVHELGGGTSSISFDYRVIAKRKGYEKIRLADKTAQLSAPMIAQHPATPKLGSSKPNESNTSKLNFATRP
jgi:hypothetical protein